MTNCVNCGAPIDKSTFAPCGYCGIYNIDTTVIDFNNDVSIGLVMRFGNCVINTLVLPKLNKIETVYETVEVRGERNQKNEVFRGFAQL